MVKMKWRTKFVSKVENVVCENYTDSMVLKILNILKYMICVSIDQQMIIISPKIVSNIGNIKMKTCQLYIIVS